jgi:hypothetical protein
MMSIKVQPREITQNLCLQGGWKTSGHPGLQDDNQITNGLSAKIPVPALCNPTAAAAQTRSRSCMVSHALDGIVVIALFLSILLIVTAAFWINNNGLHSVTSVSSKAVRLCSPTYSGSCVNHSEHTFTISTASQSFVQDDHIQAQQWPPDGAQRRLDLEV